MNLQERLFELQDLDYQAFQRKLMPTVAPEAVIGVRIPALRKLAKEFGKTQEAEVFLRTLPHVYYEENCLHGFLIEQIKDFDGCVAALDAFLPFVDNWATCDMTSPKVLKQNRTALLKHIHRWIASDHPFVIRFGILSLMRHFLEEDFYPDYLELAAQVRHKEYYVNMMIAWFFAEALVKQYDAAVPYLQQNRLETWTHNKAIQKARESFRVSPAQKCYLKTLKRLPCCSFQ